MIQELKAISIIGIVPHNGKLARLHQIVPIIESGKVFLPHQAIWLSDFEYEILMFPGTRQDDQVDSRCAIPSYALSKPDTQVDKPVLTNGQQETAGASRVA